MNAVEHIEQEISKLSPQELARFRAWYAEFDTELFDAKIEQDAKTGRLDTMADAALRAHTAGRTRAL